MMNGFRLSKREESVASVSSNASDITAVLRIPPSLGSCDDDTELEDTTLLTVRNKTVFRTFFDPGPITSSEQMQKAVKKVVKEVMCRKALRLRHDINIGIRNTEEEMRKALEQVKLYRSIVEEMNERLLSERKNVTPFENKLNLIATCKRTKASALDGIKKAMAKAEESESKLDQYKSAWEYFRTNYKEQVVAAVKKEIEKRMEQSKNNLEAKYDYTYLLPDNIKVKVEDQESSAGFMPYLI